LSELRNLEKLTLTIDYLHSTDDKVTAVIEAMKKVLAASSPPNKCLEVIYVKENKAMTFNYP